jgi:hypothetical protein
MNLKEKDILFGIQLGDISTLNKIFLNNCYDAVHFINNCISIINNSKVIQNNLDTYNPEELCRNDNLDNLFTPKNIFANDSTVNIPTEDGGDNTRENTKRLKLN